MSMCKVCHKDSEKHSGRLWLLHQQKLRCAFCGKTSLEHSIDLWDIHQNAIPKNAKIMFMQIGTGPRVPARLVKWNTVKVNGRDDPYHLEYVPIYIHCDECDSALAKEESDHADVLGKLCLRCYTDMTDQEHSWHSKPWWAVNGGKYKKEG